MEIPTGMASTKIPFSIDDIQDKITNYLEAASVKTKLFLQRKNYTTTDANYGEYSNLFWTSNSYNYNVGSTDLTYITTKIPNLRPENILYMSVISSNSKEHFYEFRPQNNAMEHYTSLIQTGTGGKRLSTATDYYFFPNGSEIKSAASTYGILAHWDRNNLILDLQSVSKTDGTIDGEITANFSAYINPYSFYIVYTEA